MTEEKPGGAMEDGDLLRTHSLGGVVGAPWSRKASLFKVWPMAQQHWWHLSSLETQKSHAPPHIY